MAAQGPPWGPGGALWGAPGCCSALLQKLSNTSSSNRSSSTSSSLQVPQVPTGQGCRELGAPTAAPGGSTAVSSKFSGRNKLQQQQQWKQQQQRQQQQQWLQQQEQRISDAHLQKGGSWGPGQSVHPATATGAAGTTGTVVATGAAALSCPAQPYARFLQLFGVNPVAVSSLEAAIGTDEEQLVLLELLLLLPHAMSGPPVNPAGVSTLLHHNFDNPAPAAAGVGAAAAAEAGASEMPLPLRKVLLLLLAAFHPHRQHQQGGSFLVQQQQLNRAPAVAAAIKTAAEGLKEVPLPQPICPAVSNLLLVLVLLLLSCLVLLLAQIVSPQVAAAFPLLELQAHAAQRACLQLQQHLQQGNHKASMQQQEQGALAVGPSLMRTVECLIRPRFHSLLPATACIAELGLCSSLKNCLGGDSFQRLQLRRLCCFFGEVFDSANPGLSVLLMQKALQAIQLQAEILATPEALLLLGGIRKLQTQLPPAFQASQPVDFHLLQLQLWPSLSGSLSCLPVEALLQVAEVYLHSALLCAVSEAALAPLQTQSYRHLVPQCRRLEPYVAALSLRSPLQQELLGALLRRLDSFELHHAANLCSALLPFTELWGDLHPLERQAGVVTPSGPPASTRAAAAAPGEAGYEAAAESSGSMRLPPLQVMGVSHAVLTEPAEATSCLCRAEKSRGAASVLSNFVLRFLSAYFGSATQQREGGQQLHAYPNGGETLSAERPTEEDRRALAAHLGPEPLLAGKLMLQTLSTEAFTAIARIATAYGYRNYPLERLLLQAAAERLQRPLSPVAVSALLLLPTPAAPPPSLVRGLEIQLRRLCEDCTDLEQLLEVGVSLQRGWGSTLLGAFQLRHHVLRIAAGCRPQFLGETEEEEDLGPQRDCVLKLEHVPKLLSLFGVHSEETAANGSCSNPSHPAGGNRLSPISPSASGLVSAVRGFPAAAFVSPPESLSLALRVLLPALYSRRLTPQDLRALLTPLVDIPNLKEMVLHAKETAPQSRLALLPDAVAHVILEAPATARDGLQHLSPLLRLVTALCLEPAVYIPPLLTALQQFAVQSLRFEDAASLFSALLECQGCTGQEASLQRLISWGLGVTSPQLTALSSSLLQQWQQQKYQGHFARGDNADTQQQPPSIEGGLDDETEVAILHCLLTGECFSDTVFPCLCLCLLSLLADELVQHPRRLLCVLASRVRGTLPPLSPSVYCALYEAFQSLHLLGGASSGIDIQQYEDLAAFCEQDTPKAFWHQQQRLLLTSFVSSALYVQLKEALEAAELPGLQPLLTTCGFCHFAAAAKPVTNLKGPPVAGLAFVCVPEEDTVAASSQGHPLLLQQQHLQQCSGRSRLLLRLLQKTNWAAVPIFLHQWIRLPSVELRAAHLKALTTGEAA
ncbi:hypothetical protein, conserved [Eimeria maxima]|uniref:Uncharacterized protein n=1 Tax=Eimeria maxima TaxID=5804 RepID=U6M854_EIMMA|nr:hypothetical protein, conserved [Eimeria maxima]CDJ59243.1 hypothetical protein, conserved [Eimeria maxima]